MAEFIKNSPFRFWCQKVLPLVYDDSLSYYELLCKVVSKLNELAENQNNLSEDIKQVAKDLNDFKEQVPGMIEQKVEEWLNNYIATKGLVNSVNGMKGDVTLTAEDVGAIANVNGSVKNNNIAAGAVTADKVAAGVIPTKLPNPQKLTFSGAVTGEYDGSKAVNIDIPAGGGGGGGAVDSVNGMTGAVVLKPLTPGEGLNMGNEGGYNGSTAQTVGIAPGGVTADKIANGVIPTQLPTPFALSAGGGLDMGGETFDGSKAASISLAPAVSKNAPGTIGGAHLRLQINPKNSLCPIAINLLLSGAATAGQGYQFDVTYDAGWNDMWCSFILCRLNEGLIAPYPAAEPDGKAFYYYQASEKKHRITIYLTKAGADGNRYIGSGIAFPRV